MKLSRYIKSWSLVAAALVAFVGCNKQIEDENANAVAVSEQYLSFAATDAEPQTVSVYADGLWVADVPEEWITVEPMSGNGNTEIVITVADNKVGGVTDTPRKAELVFKGSSRERVGKIYLNQKGDTYKGVQEYDVTGAAALEDEQVAKIGNAQVVAASKTGIVISDGKSNLYVNRNGNPTEVKLGDIVFLNGKKETFNAVPGFELDEIEVKSSGEVKAAEASDITAEVDTYASNTVNYVRVDGSAVYGILRVAGATRRVAILDPLDEFGIDELNIHKLSVTGYYTGVNTKEKQLTMVITEVKDNGIDESIIPYPVIWAMGEGADKAGYLKYTSTFSESGSFESIQGLGTISYVPATEIVDGQVVPICNGKDRYKLDVSGYNPRVTGPWPGDYWLFTGLGQVKAGSTMRIVFESRTSATGHKFWQLEYKDGENWKVAGELKTTADPGASVTYTHAMNADGSTNILVDETVKFNHNNDNCQFRFRCMANWQANGAGALDVRNGGTARLSVTDVTEAGVDFWPHLYMIVEGDGTDRPDTDPIQANIVTNEDVLAFEGIPAGPIKLTVSSDYDFTVSSDAEWISLDVTSGAAGESVDIMVSCEPTTLSSLRRAELKISSADSKKIIPIVQSAAGQDLDPFVALAANSMDISYKGQTVKVKIQSNAEYSISSDVEWISTEPLTKAMVEKTEVELYIAENSDTDSPRVGHVSFAIEGKNVESVLTVTQACKPATPSNVIFEEDFEWMRPYIDAYNAANPSKPVGKTIEDKNASANSPQVYNADFGEGFLPAFEARGWSDINPTLKCMYINDAYLKMSKIGGNNTAPQIDLKQYMPAGSTDLSVSFDYAMQIQGTGTVDAGPVVLQIVGDGEFEDGTTTKISKQFNSPQQSGELFWTRVEGVRINGATEKTKIIWINGRVFNEDGSYNWAVSGAGRFFLDNIKIEKAAAAPKIIFQDDFEWLRPLIDEYNADNSTPIGNAVTGYDKEAYASASSANAPNAYTAEPFKSKFPKALEDAGYEDLNSAKKVIYPQDCYLKFGKTSAHTSLKIKSLPLESTSDLTVEFDWCRHVQGSGIIDPVTLTLVISGDGMFENGTKYSDPLSTPQEYEEEKYAEMGWTHANVKIEGAGANTQINIVYTDCLDKESGQYNWTVSGAHRYHIDNIVIKSL